MLSRLRALRTATVLVGVLAAGTGLAVAAPAQAEDRAFRDVRGDVPARVDIRAVRVTHGMRALRVVVRLDDVRRNRDGSLGSFAVYVDSLRRRTGPEFFANVEGFHLYSAGCAVGTPCAPTAATRTGVVVAVPVPTSTSATTG